MKNCRIQYKLSILYLKQTLKKTGTTLKHFFNMVIVVTDSSFGCLLEKKSYFIRHIGTLIM
jgi:hypothetical protein